MGRPNFFLVGASKAGTTSLAQVLSDHPSVFMCQPKEPNFFNKFENVNHVDTIHLDRYLELFASAGSEKIIGEASVSYLASKMAAQHIFDFESNSRILISLRNPLERVRSLYEMYCRHGLKKSFFDVTISDPWLTKQCLYADQVQRYVDIFPREQILIIDFDDLTRNWSDTMSDIFRFLSIENFNSVRPVHRNAGGIPKNKIARIIFDRNLVLFAKKIIPMQFHQSADRFAKRFSMGRAEMNSEIFRHLSPIFVQDVQRLDSFLSSNFAERWFGANDNVNT